MSSLPEDVILRLEEVKEAIEISTKPKWHQIYKFTLTKFEIPVELQVKCDSWEEGLRYVRSKKLNSCLTVSCEDEQEARNQLYEAIQVWYDDNTLVKQNGQLIYWKIYDS